MKQRTLAGRQVSAIGLGAMPLSMNNDKEYPSFEDAVATVHAALDAGVTLIDTADIYAPDGEEMGHNERIVAEALRTWDGDASSIFVATKGGIKLGEGGAKVRDGSAAYLRSAVEKSLDILGVDQIELYQYHRPDRSLVYGDIISGLKALKDDGLVRADRHLERERRRDPDRDRRARRGQPRQRAERVLAEASGKHRRAALLRRARHRVPAVEPARRHRRGSAPGRRPVLGVPRGGRGARRQPAAGGARVGAGAGLARHSDSGCAARGIHHRLGSGGNLELSADEVTRLSESVGIFDD